MPDIMMCDARNCPKSATCYRSADSGTTANEYRQTFWLRDDNSPVGEDCKNYWKVTPAVKAAHDGSMS